MKNPEHRALDRNLIERARRGALSPGEMETRVKQTKERKERKQVT
jgi:hypothetical protein